MLSEAVEPGGTIILKSCSTGEGQNLEANFANLVAAVVPHANVYAPRQPTNSQPVLNWDGSFRDPGFYGTHGDTYRIPARVPIG